MNKCMGGREIHPQRGHCGVGFTTLSRNDAVLSTVKVYAWLLQYPCVDGDTSVIAYPSA